MKQFVRNARAAVLALLLGTAGLCAGWAVQRHDMEQSVSASVSMETDAETNPAPKLIALTFDDGPRRSTTTALLDGLAQRGVQATFFIIGAQIEGNEDILQRMDEAGHQIGIHTYDHVELIGLSQSDFDAQVEKTRQQLQNVLGHDGFVLRPPFGKYDDGVLAHADCPIILWSIDPEDWGDKNTAREVAHIVSRAQDGSIVLLHDIYPTSVEAALQVIDALHAEGYLFVTIDQLFAARGVDLQPGEVYREGYP